MAPDLVKPRWPWAVTPFNSRFLGAFYIAEMAGMAALLGWNRWSPARVILVMALVFTVVATLASLLNLGTFDFARRSPWVWFIVYGLAILVSAMALIATRHFPPAPRLALAEGQRSWLRIEWALLAAHGVALLLLPSVAALFWPWPIDAFHAQVYSAVFLSGAAGVYLLATSPTYEEMLVLGFAEALFGILATLGLFLTDAAVNRINWSGPGTYAWLAIFAAFAVSGAIKLAAVRSAGRAS